MESIRPVIAAMIAAWDASTLDAELRSRRADPTDPRDVRFKDEALPRTPFPYCVFSNSQGQRNSRQSYSDAETRTYRNILFRFSVWADSPETAADIIALILDLYDDASICPSQGGIIAIHYG